MSSSSEERRDQPVTVRFPVEVYRALGARATAGDRSFNREVVRAARAYLAGMPPSVEWVGLARRFIELGYFVLATMPDTAAEHFGDLEAEIAQAEAMVQQAEEK